MKRLHPSPALVISLIALFVALGGTGYAAIALPKNSVGAAQLKNGAVTAAKLRYGGTLPSGKTETGVWGGGGHSGLDNGGFADYPIASFVIPLAKAINLYHTIFVPGASASHCSGIGHADRGYLCVYAGDISGALTPVNNDIFDPANGLNGAAAGGFGMELHAAAVDSAWAATGTYAVTAP